ncbi:tyrosine-type recombinase/integrase [Clostridium felsineum]|uniref:Tyrosine recombinase XerC n=1 Tax=Clostridium felsineum TaxID=36839 RepID=A0A1S8LL48_9CLOT|nr:site-specific integrase [Clostridium felsineum]URZ08936.1 Tyrosine recombinase XerC [Clostridium felsineum]URZ09564.1 Tyrosine recombinase XerC [Clostridium felsineum]
MAAIQKRGKNSYRLTVSCGYDKQGKKIRKYKTIDLSHIKPNKQLEEAQKQFVLFENEVKKGLYLDTGKITFEEFIDKWLKDYAEAELAPKTLLRYKKLLDRIIPALGHIKLNKLQPTHLVEFYNNLRENGIRTDGKSGGLSERTILHHHRLISSILTCAVQWQFILNNPASRVKAPKVEKKEARHFDIEQTEYILQLLENAPIKYKTAIYLDIYGGMRLGELAGLKWSNVDFDNMLIKINHSLQHVTGYGTFEKSTKNETSNRIISLPKTVMSLLKEYKLWQNGEKSKLGNLWCSEYDYIFTTREGKPIYPGSISSWFHKFIKKHNETIMKDSSISHDDKEKYLLDNVNFHGLRHTSATILINQGIDVTTVSKRLGHARTSTTTDIYSHSLQKADRSAADKLEGLFNSKNTTKKEG